MEQYQRLSPNAIHDLVSDLAAQKYWGIVRVRDGQAWKEFDFASGGIKVTSLGDRRAPRLGEIIAARFHILPARITELAEKQPETRELIGEMIRQAGLINDEDLKWAVHRQVVTELADLYMWSGGRYHYTPGQRRPHNPEFDARKREEGVAAISWSGNIGQLLTDAKKAYQEFEQLKNAVGSGETVYAFTAAARDKLYKQGGFQRLVDADQRVVVLLDGKRSLSEIIAKVPYGTYETLRIVAKLKKAGAVKRVQ